MAGFWEEYGESLRPAIIAPTYAKLQRAKWLQATWAVARRALATTRLLIVIGYGMPQTDGFMQSMLHAALLQREKHIPLKVLVIDPSCVVLERYHKFFSPLVDRRMLLTRRLDFAGWVMDEEWRAECSKLIVEATD